MTNTTDDNEFFDTTSPNAKEVAEFLKNNADYSEGTAEEESHEEENIEQAPQINPEEGFQANWGMDTSKADEVMPQEDPIQDLYVRVPENKPSDPLFMVQDDTIPITEMEKSLYLKATLNDTPVEFEIQMGNGISMHVRSISNYEGDLAMKAALDYVQENPSMGLAAGLGQNIAQQYRVSMQITRVNGTPQDYIHYEYAPGTSSVIQDAEDLRKRSDAKMMNTQGIRYGLMLRALNVFQTKMNRLQEAAFTKDFWSPGGTD